MQGPHPSGRLRLCNAKAASSESGHRRFVSHTSMTHVIEVDDARLWLARRMGEGSLGPPCPKKTFRSIWGKIIILELRFFTKV